MAKKTSKDSEKEDEKDLEEEEEETSDDEDEDEEADEDEEEAEAAPAKATARTRQRRASDDHEHGHDDHEHEEPADEEDQYWWTPHAVMSALVLIGVLGFFGVFNKVLAPLAAKPQGGHDTKTETAKHEATPPPKPATPMPPGPGGTAQAQREMFGAKHLLVMYKGSRRAPPNIERSKDEAKARATEAMKKAKDGKTKFEDLVKEYSDEPNAGARGGDLGTFPKGAMVPEFQNALEKIKPNEVSDVVETPFGFHVILRTK
jgi:hypothetical protein